MVYTTEYLSPLGTITLACDEEAIVGLWFNGQKHFGMFAGQEETVRLRCRSRIVGVVLDRFGHDVMLVPDGPEHFTVTLPLVVSPQFFGWLFGLEDNVELLGPPEAVEGYRRSLAKVAALYGK